MEKIAEIYIALATVNEEIQAIAKQKKGPFPARSIDQIYNSLHPLFTQAGIIVLSELLEKDVRTYESTDNEGKIKRQFFYNATFKFKFVSTKDGSSVECIEDGEGSDFSDKACGKAKSYAFKYCVIRMFTIPIEAGDVDDTDSENIESKPPMATDKQLKAIHAICNEMNWDYKYKLGVFLKMDPEKVPSTKVMTKATATKFIDFLKKGQNGTP